MIFFLVHFRRYRKPVKIDIHLQLVRAIQKYRMNDIVIFINLSICICVLPCHFSKESITQYLQIICYT